MHCWSDPKLLMLIVSALNVFNAWYLALYKINVFHSNVISLKKFPLAFVFACLQYHCHKLGLLAETNLKDIYCWKLHRLPKTKLKQCFPLFVAISNKRFDFDWMSDCLIDWKLCECQKHFFSYLKCLMFYNKTKVLEMLTHQKAQPGEKTDIYLPCLRLFPNEPFSTCIAPDGNICIFYLHLYLHQVGRRQLPQASRCY